MKHQVRTILIPILCMILVLSLAGCSFLPKIGRRTDPKPPAQTETREEIPTIVPIPVSKGDGTLREYFHYDPEASYFYENCEAMRAAYAKGDQSTAFDLYDELMDQLDLIDELGCIAYIRYTENVKDSYYEKEYDYETETWIEARDRFAVACKAILEGSDSDAFRKHIGKDYCDWFEEYDPMTQEEIDLNLQELRLVQQYNTQADSLTEISCTINGKTYTFDDILAENGEKLYTLNPDLYVELYQTLLGQYNALQGAVFIELLGVRTKIAKLNGYEDYAAYADDRDYHREYTPEDLQTFKEVVKHYSGELQNYLAVFSGYDSYSYQTTEQLLSDAGSILSEISPLAKNAFSILTEQKLYSIGNESERIGGAYTIYLPKSRHPFLTIKASGGSDDAVTLSHEFGHFTAFLEMAAHPDDLYVGCLDLEETHSQGLQLLFGEKSEPLFGQDAKYIQAGNITNVAAVVVDGCVYDDWQREVYANPDMTLEEINSCYQRILQEYGIPAYPGSEYLWCDLPHNFENPMYYISYAVSAMGALQIWDLCRNDYEAGVSAWEKLVQAGENADNYSEAMKEAGLSTFYDTEKMNRILSDTLYYIIQTYYQSAFGM